MARRLSYADLEANHKQARNEATLLGVALGAMYRQEITWSRFIRETHDKGSYRMGIWGPDRADGGLLILVFRYPGQADYVSAHYLEQFNAGNGYSNWEQIVRQGVAECRAKLAAKEASPHAA